MREYSSSPTKTDWSMKIESTRSEELLSKYAEDDGRRSGNDKTRSVVDSL
jgi:hypothetical protein